MNWALIFNHKGNFKFGNLFHSLLSGNNFNLAVRALFRNFFHYQSLKGHEAGSSPSAGLISRPPTGSATTAGVRKESNEPGRWSNGPRIPQLRDRLRSEIRVNRHMLLVLPVFP